MMRSIYSVVLLSSFCIASEYKYEETPFVGQMRDGGGIESHKLKGLSLASRTGEIRPELFLLYSDAQSTEHRKLNVYRIGLNGVRDVQVEGWKSVVPYLKAGGGYEYFKQRDELHHNSLFANAGAGVKIPLTERTALRLEGLWTLSFNDFAWDSRTAVTAGISIAFGETVTQRLVTLPVESTATQLSSSASESMPSTAPSAPTVTHATLHFDTDSKMISHDGRSKIAAFLETLKKDNAASAAIIGHADSTGSREYNLRLSLGRACEVKKALNEGGVESSRLSIEGRGESEPVADNATPEGRALNRRVDMNVR